MKNIKKLLLGIIFTFIFISCEEPEEYLVAKDIFTIVIVNDSSVPVYNKRIMCDEISQYYVISFYGEILPGASGIIRFNQWDERLTERYNFYFSLTARGTIYDCDFPALYNSELITFTFDGLELTVK